MRPRRRQNRGGFLIPTDKRKRPEESETETDFSAPDRPIGAAIDFAYAASHNLGRQHSRELDVMTTMQRSITRCVLALALLTWALASSSLASGSGGGLHKTANGLTVYLGVLPAAMIRGQHVDHPEEEMHGGIPRGRHNVHLLAALFDDATGERVDDVEIKARVTPLGLAGMSRDLEPMKIADTLTYGNYFSMPSAGTYRIVLTIMRPEQPRPLKLEFSYEHSVR